MRKDFTSHNNILKAHVRNSHYLVMSWLDTNKLKKLCAQWEHDTVDQLRDIYLSIFYLFYIFYFLRVARAT